MAAPQQQGQADNSMGYLWIVIGIFVAGFAIWYFAHDYIVYAFLKLKSAEIDIISLFTNKLNVVQNWIHLVPIHQVEFHQVALTASLVGGYLMWPFALVLLMLAFVVYRSNPVRKYKKTYSMERLVQTEKSNWPHINSVAKETLQKTDLLEGPWSMALNPMEFAKKNKLLQEALEPLKEGMLQREQKIVVTVLRGRANKVFTLQLGKPFTNVDALPMYVKALFAIFAARANRDRSGADQLLAQISESAARKTLNFKGAEALCNKHKEAKLIRSVTDKHAYVLTMMASMLELARIDGVLATAEFIWLKPVDRKLWYMLNNVGRQTAFTEIAGPFAHWLAERELGQKIITPMIDEATNALELAISEVLYKPDEESDIASAEVAA